MNVLSLSLVRDLWSDDGATGDTRARLAYYADHVDAYRVLVPVRRALKLAPSVPVGRTGRAYALPGRTLPGRWGHLIRAGIAHGRQMRAQVVQAQDPVFTGLAGWIVSRRLGCPLNVCVYGANPYDPAWLNTARANRLTAPVARFVLTHAESVQVDGTMTAASLVAAGIPAERVHVKPIVPTNLPHFASAAPDAAFRARALGEHGTTLALFVGRLVEQKHLTALLDVAAALRTRVPGLRYALVGEGPDQPALDAYARRLGVDPLVSWWGPQPHTALPGLYAASDLFLLTSRFEGYARVLMEAATAGLPIVTTRVSGSDDAVVDGTSGYIVPIDDVAALAGATERLALDPARRKAFGAAGAAHLRAHADPTLTSQQQVQIWQQLLQSVPPDAASVV